ncbi:MAG: ribonuclease P protein component [Planctomycetes bacterium]|nr:ribonuclease P protein component [Planctomycetota bacterium]
MTHTQDLRFRRTDRVLHKPEFDRAFEGGRKAFAKGLVVYVHDAAVGHARLGLVTSRRFGNAVHRNRARRLLREAFRLEKANLPALDLIALPQPGRFPDDLAGARRALQDAVGRAARHAPSRPRTTPP